jgi:hypothetical protein
MKDLDITQVFCEVLTGLGFLLVVFPVLVTVGPYNFHEAIFAIVRLSIAGLGAILVSAYLIGTIVDAVGMALDQLFLNKFIHSSEPSEDDRAKFWRSVSQHVLAYRDAQWTYYSCYRNLFILFIPGSILWTTFVWMQVGRSFGMLTAIGFILLEAAFFITMKSLVGIYSKITKSFSAP